MYYNLAQLLREPIGSTRDYVVDDSFVGPEGGMDRAQGWVRVVRTHQGFIVRAELETQVRLTCSRCIDRFESRSELTMEEESFPINDSETDQTIESAEEQQGEIHLDDQHVLDMAEVVRQYVLTAVPIKPLCCEECSGLCPECGTNLNKEKCKCNAAPVDPPHGGLWRSC
jgi:uncharacterized protein